MTTGEQERIFKVTSDQLQKAFSWQKEHGCGNGPLNYQATIPESSLSFIFTPTAVMDVIEIQCRHCGDQLDLTEWDLA